MRNVMRLVAPLGRRWMYFGGQGRHQEDVNHWELYYGQ